MQNKNVLRVSGLHMCGIFSANKKPRQNRGNKFNELKSEFKYAGCTAKITNLFLVFKS